jgi:hypothetical protein
MPDLIQPVFFNYVARGAFVARLIDDEIVISWSSAPAKYYDRRKAIAYAKAKFLPDYPSGRVPFFFLENQEESVRGFDMTPAKKTEKIPPLARFIYRAKRYFQTNKFRVLGVQKWQVLRVIPLSVKVDPKNRWKPDVLSVSDLLDIWQQSYGK